MPGYPVRCNQCGFEEDQWLSMPSGRESPQYTPCSSCGGTVTRVYTVPNEISNNTWRPHWNSNLSDTAEPVYVSTRDEYYARLRQRNERPVEAGEIQQSIKDQKTRRKEAKDAYGRYWDKQMERPFAKALDEKGGIPE